MAEVTNNRSNSNAREAMMVIHSTVEETMMTNQGYVIEAAHENAQRHRNDVSVAEHTHKVTRL
jgi:predicted kinase